jgi:hypothetical protein
VLGVVATLICSVRHLIPVAQGFRLRVKLRRTTVALAEVVSPAGRGVNPWTHRVAA